MKTEAEIAWAAGLFEGEGNIQVRTNGVWLQLGSTDRDVVEHFLAVVDAGAICTQYRNRKKPIHIWHLGKRAEVQRILIELLPWLGDRRGAKAREGLDWIATFYRVCVREGCEETFLAGRMDRVYCSNSCAEKAHRDRARENWREKNWAPV